MLLVLPALSWACYADGSAPAMPATASASATPAPATTPTAAAPAAAQDNGDVSALHRLHCWSDRIIQGEQPEGEAAFREIAALGATTVLSVDGAIPDVEGAAQCGLKYIHVPIGYDGISPEEQARIVKAAKESPGPIYIHCHHGLHRGPAAAALVRIEVDGVSREEAFKGLEESGCSPSYDGLYAAVKSFVAPSEEQLAALPPLPSAVRPKGIQDAMVRVDPHFEYFKALKSANWSTPADEPDKSPAHELTILRELFAEVDRLDEAKAKGEDFLAHARAAQEQLASLQAALEAGDAAASAKAFDGLTADCKSCHVAYRD